MFPWFWLIEVGRRKCEQKVWNLERMEIIQAQYRDWSWLKWSTCSANHFFFIFPHRHTLTTSVFYSTLIFSLLLTFFPQLTVIFHFFSYRTFLLHVKMFITPTFLKFYSLSYLTSHGLFLLLWFCFLSVFGMGSFFIHYLDRKYSQHTILDLTPETWFNLFPWFYFSCVF
jgi:hypothetical protein